MDGNSAPCAGATPTLGTGFVDNEVPSGLVDGTNGNFTLASAPNPPASLELSRNGLVLTQGVDYTLNNANITSASNRVPMAGDTLVAFYRVAVSLPGVAFIDGEVVSGTLDGTNLAFSLSRTPNPIASLVVYRNGLRLKMSLDYMLSGNIVIFQPSLAPRPGDLLLASYRIGQ